MKVYFYGDNVDTDVIIPARHLTKSDPAHLRAHCMEDIDADFAKTVEEGDIVLVGRNFGCGSSREHAPLALKASGVKAVIASSFARIFYRNSVNIGLPIVECPEAVSDYRKGDELDVDLDSGIVTNKTQNKTYQAQPMAEFQKEIMKKGGLMFL